ncbi:hypothetical protein ACAW74_03770 [Fibrella sp. WM1]|uniref:hypothetical protein n=1 Tax=Fibrella musci TaxID=3242485 RepID=UPI0035203CEE
MKKLVLLIAPMLAVSQLAWAQTERGVSWWSGGLNAASSHATQFQQLNEASALELRFTQGTFIQTDLLLGADLRLSRSKNLKREGSNLDAVTDDRQTAVAAAPFIRRFWGKNALRGYVGGGALVELSRNRLLTANTKTRDAEDMTTSWRIRPELQAGLFYAITPRWGVDLQARSSVAPIAFTDLNLSLVLLTGVKAGPVGGESKKIPTQLLAGNWIVSGTFDVGNDRQQLTSAAGELATNVETRQAERFTISPSLGFFAGRRWLVGVSVPISHQVQRNEFVRSATQTVSGITSDITTDGIGVAPFAKKYLLKGNFGPFVAARVGWQRERTYGLSATADVRSTTYSWRVGGGLAYLLGKRFIVEGELAGVGSQWTNGQSGGEANRQVDVSVTLRPAFTMSYVFL